MTVNESSTDRIIRAIIGIALLLIALFAVTDTILKVVLIVLAAVALFTDLSAPEYLDEALGFDRDRPGGRMCRCASDRSACSSYPATSSTASAKARTFSADAKSMS